VRDHEAVCEQNIVHFEKLLAETSDPTLRMTLNGLLATAKRELAVLDADQKGRRSFPVRASSRAGCRCIGDERAIPVRLRQVAASLHADRRRAGSEDRRHQNEMPNLPFPKGTEMSVRLAHVFEMKDGKIVKEIAYEIFREKGAPNAVDAIPEGCEEVRF
jgi:hypothetical protein